MTVTTMLDRQYFNGDGSNKVFPFNFRFFTNDQIYVSLIAPDGTITPQSLTTNYTLTGALQAGGGTVTMNVAPPFTMPATRVFIQRVLSQVQPTSIRNQGKFYPEIHEDAFDRMTMLIQQALAGLSNSLQLTFSKTGWNFLGYRGINAADPINAQDVTTKSWVSSQIDSVTSYSYGLYLKSIAYAEALVAGVVGGYGAFIQAGAGAVTRTFQDKMRDIVSAKDFGAVGDGITDDSAAVQALIDQLSAQGGGSIYFPRGIYRLNVVLKKYVSLVGASWGAVRGLGVSSSNINRWVTTFKAAGPGFVVDTVEGTGNGSVGINGIDFIGLGAAVPGGGVKIRSGNGNGIFRSMMFSGFADEALISEALVGRFSDLMCTNCLLRRVRTERAGAITIKGADNYIDNVEGNTGITGIVSDDLFLCGIYIGGANNYALNLMGELSEIGVFVTAAGASHKIVNSRADLNYGHGFVGSAMFSNCHALNNSNGSPGVYSGFVSNSAAGIQYTGCRAVGAHKYGADVSSSDFTDLTQRPHFSNFVSSGHVTAEVAYPATNGSVIGLTGAHLRNITAAGDISVAGGINSIRFSHVTDTVITGFTGEHIGQMVTVVATAAATILSRSTNFIVHGVDGAGQKRLQVGRAYTFVKGQTAWIETTDNCIIPVVSTRPNTFAVPGMMVFDSVLNKPIWRNPANTGWVDATGTSV